MRYHGRIGKAEAIQLITTARLRGVGAMCICGHLGGCENSCHLDTGEGAGMGECLVKDCLCQRFQFLRSLRRKRKGAEAPQPVASGQPEALPVKRKRGRPRKVRPEEAPAQAVAVAAPQPQSAAAQAPQTQPAAATSIVPLKRKRGRPRKVR
ncbi:MAG: hypothetical protein QW379_05480, partial [Thermoplasmata archaeon]